jgi:hypothetical protein
MESAGKANSLRAETALRNRQESSKEHQDKLKECLRLSLERANCA